jgi:hypothetical protein
MEDDDPDIQDAPLGPQSANVSPSTHSYAETPALSGSIKTQFDASS